MTWADDFDMEVSFAFGDDPFDISPTYVEVTSQVVSVTINRGRTDYLSPFPTGTCTVVLKDETRDFDPLNTGSPYWVSGATQIVPRVQMRVQVDDSGGGPKTLFEGHVRPRDGWQYSYSAAPAFTTVTVHCEDLLGLLATAWLDEIASNHGGNTASARVGLVCDEAGIPGGWRSWENGTITLAPTTWGENALEHVQKVVEAEGGVLYATRTGEIRMDGRYAVQEVTRQSTVQDTFDDTASYADYLHGQIEIDYRTDVVNKVSAFNGAGEGGTATDATSIAAYGEARLERTGLLVSDGNQAEALAEWLVAGLKDPEVSIKRISFAAWANDALRDAAATSELHDRILVRFTPPNDGDTGLISQEVLVESIVHQMTLTDWTVTWGFNPAALWDPADGLSLMKWDVSTWDNAVWAW